MLPLRIIPCLLLNESGLVKTQRFRDPTYIGDPCNAVRIFNEKEVDELILVDIDASPSHQGPKFELVRDIVSEAFMPVAYGGGIATVEDARKILFLGVEKIIIATAAVENPQLISDLAESFGSQSVVVCMNVMQVSGRNYVVCTHGARRQTSHDPVEFAHLAERFGAGEIVVNSIDRDGTMNGYDIALVRSVSEAVQVPTIACGGAGTVNHLAEAHLEGGASGVAAGSMFVFHGRHRAVLINYPKHAFVAESNLQ